MRLTALYGQHVPVVYKATFNGRFYEKPAAKIEAQGVFQAKHIACHVKFIIQPLAKEGHVALGYHPAHTQLDHIIQPEAVAAALPDLEAAHTIDEVKVSAIGMLKVQEGIGVKHLVTIDGLPIDRTADMGSTIVIYYVFGMVKIELNSPLALFVKEIADTIYILRYSDLRKDSMHVRPVMRDGIGHYKVIAIAIKGTFEVDIRRRVPGLDISPADIEAMKRFDRGCVAHMVRS